MQDNRSSNTSSRSNRRRTVLVLLLAVGTLVAVGAAGTALWGRGDAVRPAVSSPQSQATTGGGNSQSTGLNRSRARAPTRATSCPAHRNSAGQAVVYLAGQVAKVWLLVRGRDLAASMSRYLVDRIAGLPNVEVLTQTSITGLEGSGGMLEAIRWRGPSGQEVRRPVRHLFLFIGANPNTDWLAGSGVVLDPKGFVSTGTEIDGASRPLETSVPGVFAIGDVRSGSVKRVAAAVGEGAQVVATLHAFLAAGERELAIAATH